VDRFLQYTRHVPQAVVGKEKEKEKGSHRLQEYCYSMNSNNDSLSAALAMLALNYATDPLPEGAEKIVINLPQSAAKVKAPKGAKAKKAAPISAAPKAAVMPSNLDGPGTLNAEQFLLAFRDAGKRVKEDTNLVTGEVTMRPIFDGSLVREDTIKAIHAYIGYDPAIDFGTQDIAARAKAQREIRGNVQPAAFHRRGGASVAPSIVGYIAGAPDHAAKHLANLMAQERVTVEAVCNLRTQPEDALMLVGGMQFTAGVMLAIEVARLEKIREDIDAAR
jgi:hypothetical protein